MIDEREAHEAFERLVGGPDRGFRLLELWRTAGYTVSGDRFQVSPPKRTQESVFRRMAKEWDYTEEQITAFLALP